MDQKKKNILIVDDEREICEIIATHISEMTDYYPFQANSVQEGITTLNKQHIDVVISDIRMPGRDGMDLLNHMNNLPSPHPHIIFISAIYGESLNNNDILRHISTEMTRESIQEKGGYTYLPKPLNYSELLEILDEILSK